MSAYVCVRMYVVVLQYLSTHLHNPPCPYTYTRLTHLHKTQCKTIPTQKNKIKKNHHPHKKYPYKPHPHPNRPGFIGCFQINLNVVEAAEFAAQRVQQVCRETYGVSPDVRVLGDTQVDITYIPTHLDYMLYELLKNSVRYYCVCEVVCVCEGVCV